MPSIRRRTLLGSLASAAVVGLSGCSSSCPDSNPPSPSTVVRATGDGPGFASPPTGSWPTPRFDATNAGFAPSRRSPTAPSLRWRSHVPAPTSPPTVADGRVYLATDGGTTALSLGDGTRRWLNADVRAVGRDGAVAPPVVGDGHVYVATADAIVALRPGDGSVAWRHEDDSPRGAPAVVDGSLFVPTAAGVVSLDGREGTRRWGVEVSADRRAPSRPAVADGTVVVAADALVAVDAATGDHRWDVDARADSHPVVADGSVFLGSHEGVTARRLADGTTRWSVDRGGGRTFTAPVVTPETVYAVERPGEAPDATFALDRSADGPPDPRWCSQVGEGAVTAAADGHAFGLRSGDADDAPPAGLVAFTQRFGEATWGYAADRPLAPAVLDEAVVVADRRGTVAALGGE